jgi:hypothetical protein
MTIAIRLLAAAVLLPVAGTSVGAQQARGATVRAVVHDSLSGGPLAGATVQLVSLADRRFIRTADTDSAGTLAFAGIPVGRYRVGFMHPLLDELGVTAPDGEVLVEAEGTYRVALAVPSPGRLRTAVCGARTGDDSVAAVVGTVRDPRDRMPLADAAVTAQWIEISVGSGGIQQRAPRITARTGSNGWFALCGLPPGVVTVSARLAKDSMPRVDLHMKANEFRRRDMYVSAPGVGQLRGTVVSADSARPLAGARVAVAGGPQTLTGPTGEWSLSGVPLGTHSLEVRALGYYPEQRPVDVIADAAPTTVALTTFRAVLDAIRVTAQRTERADMGGFASRARRSGMGRYMSAEQVQRRNVLETSDLLKTMPGFVGDGSLMMKSGYSDGAGNFDVNCPAEVYIDGHLMRGISAAELDALVKPEHIEGIEVFSAGSPKPPQFDSGMSGCGSLVIWQKPLSERRRR